MEILIDLRASEAILLLFIFKRFFRSKRFHIEQDKKENKCFDEW